MTWIRRPITRVFSYTLSVPLAVAGCEDTDCQGWQEDQSYSVDLLERYDESSTFEFTYDGASEMSGATCGETLEPLVGDVLTVKPTKLGDNCEYTFAEVSPTPPLINLERHARSVEPYESLQVVYSGEFSGCSAVWRYRFYGPAGGSNVLSAPEPGKVPPVVVERHLDIFASPLSIMSPPMCKATTCTDRFVVRVKKL